MSDELKNKNGKVKVMYVRSDDDSDKRTQNPRTGKGGGRPDVAQAGGTDVEKLPAALASVQGWVEQKL